MILMEGAPPRRNTPALSTQVELRGVNGGSGRPPDLPKTDLGGYDPRDPSSEFWKIVAALRNRATLEQSPEKEQGI